MKTHMGLITKIAKFRYLWYISGTLSDLKKPLIILDQKMER